MFRNVHKNLPAINKLSSLSSEVESICSVTFIAENIGIGSFKNENGNISKKDKYLMSVAVYFQCLFLMPTVYFYIKIYKIGLDPIPGDLKN